MSRECELIDEILNRMKICISSDLITYEMNGKEREKNEKLFCKYVINSQQRNKILNEPTVQNYCESILDRQKTDPQYENTLYVFGIEKELRERITGNKKIVPIYIKFQFFKIDLGETSTLIISFHEAEKPLRYMYK